MIDSHYVLMLIPLSQLLFGLVTQYVLEKLFTYGISVLLIKFKKIYDLV